MSNARIFKGRDSVLFGMPSLERKTLRTEKGMTSSRQSIDEMERDAYEKGFAAGEKAGLEMGSQKAEVLLSRIERMVREIEQYRSRIIEEIEPQLVELSSEMAIKVIREELSIKPEIMVTIVKEAMRKLERTGPITIKMNPAVHELFKRLKPQLLEVHPDIIFDLDPSVVADGQVVIGASEEIVTDIDSQLGNIMEDMGGGSGRH
ncbi:MAG: hypothetical protein HZB31_14980 [Nitrospirae bacterium]|nr:hypothetical protein [Nitrospirota bacterium]